MNGLNFKVYEEINDVVIGEIDKLQKIIFDEPYATDMIEKRERQRFEKAIIRANGNRVEAAKQLGISRATFFRRAKELGLVRKRSCLDSGI
ncbi:MAG: helix-turn-helix domain-containing protein [Bdellovibrionota bacterium]